MAGPKRALEDAPDFHSNGKKPHGGTTVNREVCCVIVRNLPKNFNNRKIERFFHQCGEIRCVDTIMVKEKDAKIARIEFTSYNEVLAALTMSLKTVGCKEIVVEAMQGCTLWVTNFPPRYDGRELRRFFEDLGFQCLSVRLPSLRYNAGRRFAYVDLPSPQSADAAANTLNGMDLDGYNLVVKLSDPESRAQRSDAGTIEKREVLIRGLDFIKVTIEKLQGLVEPFGEVEKLIMPPSSDSADGRHNRGFAFVTYKDAAAAEAALALHNTVFEDRRLTVAMADRKPYLERQKVKQILVSRKPQPNILGLFPISDTLSKECIRSLVKEKAPFLEDNMLEDILLVSDHEGALLIFCDEKTAAKVALALHMSTYGKVILNCSDVRSLKQHSPQLAPTRNKVKSEEISSSLTRPDTTKRMTNDDFRKFLLHR
ncbi:AER285Cp [Eremothecium gossypii ATCC 10895]|uniref:U4/U6 snRNA-associated-splicing factor PRP24 n=1 Tax=Eremothecium gossypii (strain ATCC 10895 / CBS 109.51 / FGSC 9923 / NRRL Y-1056) TaxID=284811 RepID=Q756X0_EREGS|nr:AER285Cp [Eremothecium gossypii ATCC 10895]AAS52966.1 AER285Cp [Eremothecium gossypii ATCC 10895]AEY97274.1 FAER285Cp [Eremothecium gossypii FDAG1]